MEKSVRKITSAAAWLMTGSMSWFPRLHPFTAARPASSIAGKVSRRRPPSKAGSMIRRCRAHVSPLVRKTEAPSSGRKPFAHPVGFREIQGPRLQDVIYEIGLVDEEGPEERRPELRHPGAIKPLGLCRQDIAPKQPHIAPERDTLLPARRVSAAGRGPGAVMPPCPCTG
jgi:hypothetical protein